MPVTYITSLVFGGSNFDILYATTSKLKLSEEDRRREPTAGAVFAVHGLGVKGFPGNEYVL